MTSALSRPHRCSSRIALAGTPAQRRFFLRAKRRRYGCGHGVLGRAQPRQSCRAPRDEARSRHRRCPGASGPRPANRQAASNARQGRRGSRRALPGVALWKLGLGAEPSFTRVARLRFGREVETVRATEVADDEKRPIALAYLAAAGRPETRRSLAWAADGVSEEQARRGAMSVPIFKLSGRATSP